MSKFKESEMVRIVDSVASVRGVGFTDDMISLSGQTVFISEVCGDHTYKISVSDKYWHEKLFVPWIPDKTTTVTVGDTVCVK